MKRPIVSVMVVSLVAAAAALILTTMAFATGPVVHRVNVGSPDACLALVGAHTPAATGISLSVRESTPMGACPANTRTDSLTGMAFMLSLTAWSSTVTERGSAA